MRFWNACLFSVGLAVAPVGHAVAQDAAPASGAADSEPAAATGAFEPVRLDDLLGAFADMPGLEASFVEEKHIGLLAAPLVSEGRLYFAPPGRLAREVVHPRPSNVVITPTEVRFSDENGQETITLDSRPELRALVESMVWLLAGNAEALLGAYVAEIEGDSDGWSLRLTPRERPLSDLIGRMEVRGQGLRVAEVRVVETTGDETVTRIVEADPARAFSDDELRTLFGDSTQ